MNSKQLNYSSKVTSLTFTKPTIIHFVPDFGKTTSEMIHTSGIELHNCFALITKSKLLKLGSRSFNGRELFLKSKENLGKNNKEHQTSVKIKRAIPQSIPQNRFLVIDHSLTSQATQYISELTSVKRGLSFLFQQLSKEFKFIKSKFPNHENMIIFGLNKQQDELSLIDVLQRLISVSKDDLNINFRAFDRFTMASVTLSDKSLTMPIIGFNNKGKVVAYNANLQFIKKLQNEFSMAVKDLTNVSTVKSISDDSGNTSLAKDISKTKLDKSVAVDTEEGEVQPKVEINRAQLNKILRKYKIKDRTIGENIKTALDNYIISNEKFDESDLEEQIFRAIHLTIFGTAEISEEYRNNPAKLISKLEEVNTYSKAIDVKNLKEDYICDPADIIGLDKVTGLVRQEYEFSDNIHKNIKTLFKSLENRKDSPIKIVSFKHKYQDDNLNRIINYEITLQNQAGGYDKPYTVNVKVPALVNDRYFKLNGKQYILANQQFFAPITKTDPNKCRLLSSFAMMTLSVENLKFNISELEKIIEYISIKYPELIETLDKDKNRIIGATFANGMDIDIKQSPFYTDDRCEVITRDGQFVAIYNDDDVADVQLGKGISEFIYDKLLLAIQSVNPDETLNKSQKSIPYIQVHVSGVKIPVIIYMWQQIGLINGLVKLNLNHEFIKKGETTKSQFKEALYFDLAGDDVLVIETENRQKELLANGLLLIDKKKFRFNMDDLKNPEAIIDFIQSKNGTRSVALLNNATENIIDPITKDILEFQDKPTNMIGLINDEMIDKLLNDQPDSLTDLKIYRSRQAEIMFNLLYSELMMAHSMYKNNLSQNDENSKIFLKPDYVINCLLGVDPQQKGNATVEHIQAYTPIDELKLASKLIKTGPQGVPNARTFKKDHRNIHPSYYGNIGANATSEYAPVGIINHMTLNPLISNQYGSYGTKDISKANGWDFVSLDEALVPFINEMDATRAILAYTHRAQASPIKNGDVPMVATGAEFVVPQLASKRFLQKGKRSGKVIAVEYNNYVKVKYDDTGEEDYIDITPRLATTKRASHVRLGMNTLEPGTKFKKDEMIAWTDNFNGDAYASGKNLKCAVMNYLGFSHEDGYVISSKTAADIQTEVIDEVSVIIPSGAKVHDIQSDVNTITEENDILVEFSYTGDLEDYIEQYGILDNETTEEENAIFDLIGDNIRLTSPGGEITQIKIYVNDQKTADPMLLSVWRKIIKDLKDRQKKYSTLAKNDKEKLEAIDNLDMSQVRVSTHKHRGVLFDGVQVKFFIKRSLPLTQGDKLANRFGAKGIVTKVIEEEKECKAEAFGDIDIFISPISVLGRKNLAFIKELYIGKIFYLLPDIVKSKFNDKRTSTNSVKQLLLSVYKVLDPTNNSKYVKSISKKLSSMTDTKFKNAVDNGKMKFNFIIEPFVNIPMDNIKKAAELLSIELDEHVYLTETDTWSKTKVPVGIMYTNRLEQLASDYESLRSTGPYVSVTGQPKKGRSNQGGQAIGNLDIYNLLSYDAPNLLNELLTLRSDDFNNKRFATIDIIQNGNTSIPAKTGNSATQNMHRIHMIGMGLKST